MKGKEAVAIGLLEHAYNEVDDKSQVSLAKGILEEKSGNNDDVLISYMQSQMLEKSDKSVTAERIYSLFLKKL